jgi:hypothetical protein
MSSGARSEEALPGTALGGIAMSILTFYYGDGTAKFPKEFICVLVLTHQLRQPGGQSAWLLAGRDTMQREK